MNMVCNFTRRYIGKLFLLLALPLLAAAVSSCDDDDDAIVYLPSDLKVGHTVLPDTIKALSTADITILGNGFANGDAITLTNDSSDVYNGNVNSVTAEAITFTLPSNFPQSGKYTVRVVRGEEDVVLGNSYIELVYDFNIQNLAIPAKYKVTPIEDMTISGTGFMDGDVITLAPVTVNKNKETIGAPVKATTVQVSSDQIKIAVPRNLYASAETKFYVGMIRNSRSADLGATSLTFGLEAPVKAGYNLRGVVSCEFQPLEGVVVSDGVDVTTTDANGFYYLNSDKSLGHVFISTPSGYAAATAKGQNTPLNFARLSSKAEEAESHNFELKAEKQHSYVLLNLADMHLANRNNDVKQFEDGFIKDVNSLIKQYKDQGTTVYALTLGDQSWDQYWYTNSFAIPEAMKEIYKINCPVYNCMGNHDNDPYVADNFGAQKPWIENVCPDYYSFNLGNVHYVVLDNINYINNGASKGVIGDRSYTSAIDPVQMNWLKKDLATITDKTKPVALCMHINMHSYPYLNSNHEPVQSVSMASGRDLLAAVADFQNVKILTGHTHVNYDGISNDGRVVEHNTAAVCATWWWTGKNDYAGNHLCRDGVPGGYGILEVTGSNIKQRYKSIGYDLSYQFRTTDLNQVTITADRFAPKCTDATLKATVSKYTHGYEKTNLKDEVLILVFNYGRGWSIKVTENGRELTTTRVSDKDPLHIISYEMQRLNHNATPTDGFCTLNSHKTFKVTASAPNTPLEITVTDPYGNVYTETMERPKAFHALMK